MYFTLGCLIRTPYSTHISTTWNMKFKDRGYQVTDKGHSLSAFSVISLSRFRQIVPSTHRCWGVAIKTLKQSFTSRKLRACVIRRPDRNMIKIYDLEINILTPNTPLFTAKWRRLLPSTSTLYINSSTEPFLSFAMISNEIISGRLLIGREMLRRSYLISSLRDSGFNSPGSSPDWESLCCVLWTLYSQSASLQPGTQMATENVTLGYPCDGLASHPGGSKIIIVASY